MARGVDALADVVIAPRSDHAVLTHRFVIDARLLHCRADGSLERARLERGPAAADAREVRAAVHTMAKVVARHALATVVRDRRVIERHASEAQRRHAVQVQFEHQAVGRKVAVVKLREQRFHLAHR